MAIPINVSATIAAIALLKQYRDNAEGQPFSVWAFLKHAHDHLDNQLDGWYRGKLEQTA